MTPEQVERVAEILERTAYSLRAAYTAGDGTWYRTGYGHLARRDYDEYLALACAARNMLARYLAARKGAK